MMKSQPVQPGQISPYDDMRKVNFVPEVEQFSTWHLFFFEFSFVSMSVYKIENP